MLSFMDSFSVYHKIQMHLHDKEKTSFMTNQGTYCYKVMPFGLKNVGANLVLDLPALGSRSVSSGERNGLLGLRAGARSEERRVGKECRL